MIYWIILIILIALGIYDLILYIRGKSTVTQIIHAYIGVYEIPMWSRFAVTIACSIFSWYLGGIELFIPVLCGWLLCHLIGWDF